MNTHKETCLETVWKLEAVWQHEQKHRSCLEAVCEHEQHKYACVSFGLESVWKHDQQNTRNLSGNRLEAV